MTVAIWLAARIRCLVSGHDVAQFGRFEYCRRCGATWWDLEVKRYG